MNTKIEIPKDDTFNYKLVVRKKMPQRQSTVSVTVLALVGTDQEREALQERIITTLKQFIDGVWEVSSMERLGKSIGFERLKMTARTRVNPEGVWNLEERAEKVSSEGLELHEPEVDYALSAEEVDKVVEAMRLDVLRQVVAALPEINEASQREWRIGHIDLGHDKDALLHQMRTMKGAQRQEDFHSMYNDDGTVHYGAAEKIMLTANVTLHSAAM